MTMPLCHLVCRVHTTVISDIYHVAPQQPLPHPTPTMPPAGTTARHSEHHGCNKGACQQFIQPSGSLTDKDLPLAPDRHCVCQTTLITTCRHPYTCQTVFTDILCCVQDRCKISARHHHTVCTTKWCYQHPQLRWSAAQEAASHHRA